MQWEEEPLVDTGRAEEIYVSGLGAVERVDDATARLAWCVNRQQGGGRTRMIRVALIAPVASLGPAFDMCVTRLGSGILVPVMGPAMRRLLT